MTNVMLTSRETSLPSCPLYVYTFHIRSISRFVPDMGAPSSGSKTERNMVNKEEGDDLSYLEEETL